MPAAEHGGACCGQTGYFTRGKEKVDVEGYIQCYKLGSLERQEKWQQYFYHSLYI